MPLFCGTGSSARITRKRDTSFTVPYSHFLPQKNTTHTTPSSKGTLELWPTFRVDFPHARCFLLCLFVPVAVPVAISGSNAGGEALLVLEARMLVFVVGLVVVVVEKEVVVMVVVAVVGVGVALVLMLMLRSLLMLLLLGLPLLRPFGTGRPHAFMCCHDSKITAGHLHTSHSARDWAMGSVSQERDHVVVCPVFVVIIVLLCMGWCMQDVCGRILKEVWGQQHQQE
jgi:hypothetical protein